MRIVRSSMVALGLSLLLAGTAAAAKVDQSQPDSPIGFTLVGDGELGQKFTAGRTGYLTSVRLWPTTDRFGDTVRVRAVVGGQPTDPVLASAQWTSHASNQWVRVTFDEPVRMVAGRHYAVSVWGANVSLRASATDPYPGGVATFRSPTWTDLGTYDLAFQTFVRRAVGDLDWVGVKDAPAWNAPRAGQTVKVRFTLGGDWGTRVIKGGWPKVRRVNCATRKPIAGTEWQVRPFGGALAYSDATERYTLSWKVPAAWGSGAMRCRELRVRLIDGSTHRLFYRFRVAA